MNIHDNAAKANNLDQDATTAAHAPVNRWKAVGAFLLLHLYFVSNLLSFGFWKSSVVVFGYLAVFYGVWLVGLTLLLGLVLRISSRLCLTRFDSLICGTFSLPFCFGLWLPTIEVDSGISWWMIAILFFPAMFCYYRISFSLSASMAVLMISFCGLSFIGHSEIWDDFERSLGRNAQETDVVSLNKTSNIHVIMFDALTHSAFSETFMGVRNPAADYLATLDDTIYAGHMGFVEQVPTNQSWATLFEIGRNNSNNYSAFSGRSPSLLTDLLRKHSYYIQTGFANTFFGAAKGKYVDDYVHGVTELKDTLICRSHEVPLGFCSELSYTMFGKYRRLLGESYQFYRSWPKTVFDLIEQAEQKTQGPVFSAFYIYSPVSHTLLNHLSGDAEMVERYKNEIFIPETQRAQKLMEDINRLRQRFKDSIFIISGDHGPWLSRTEKEDRRFIVLDRHGVALALLNASNLCPWSRDWLAQQKYLTPSRMLAASLACDGESRKLTENFQDNEEFIHFGETLALSK